MNTGAKINVLADSGSLSGQFRLADTGKRMKCMFWEAMNNRVGTFTDEVAAVSGPTVKSDRDPFGLLTYAHNGDSQLGTGLVKNRRRSIISMVQDVRGGS